MGFAQESGYTPSTVETILQAIMLDINTQFGTTYTWETFVGSNFYKYYYALAQRAQENEAKASEIFSKLADYAAITNESISRPVVTPQGLIDKLETEGYVASVKPMFDDDAGKIYICVDKEVEGEDPWEDTDDYADDKLAVCEIIKDCTVAGCVTQGDQVESIVLTNGQSFDFKYALPDRIETYLRLTTVLSDNNQVVISSPEDVKELLLANIAERYRLGKAFEPMRYFNQTDAPWAGEILLEWSVNEGMDWFDSIRDSDFDELLEFDLANVTLVES
jgi:hypothetical protein